VAEPLRFNMRWRLTGVSWPVAKPVAERDVLGPHGQRTSTVRALVEKSRDSAQRGRIFAPVSRTRKLAAQGLHVRADCPAGLLRGICYRVILYIPASSLKRGRGGATHTHTEGNMLEYGSSLIKIGSNYTARGCQESRSTCISRIRATELEPRRSCVSFALWRTSAPPSKLLFRPSPCPPPSTFKVPACGMKTKLSRNLPVQTSSAGAWFAHVQHEISATFSTHPGG